MQALIVPTIISFIVVLIIGPIVIKVLQKLKFGQVIRSDGPQTHMKKAGTPSMGGIMIIIGTFVSSLIFIRGYDPYVVVGAIIFIGFACIGFIDDYGKIKKKQSLGLKAWQKAAMQFVLSGILAVYTYQHVGTSILIPFTNNSWDIGFWIIPLVIFVTVGASNSTNLTDGIDGLLGSLSVVYFAVYVIIFAAGIIPTSGNMLIICGALAGGCLGFLFFNRYPAKVIMGDLGSLSLGAMVAYVAIISKTILYLPIIGFMFIVATISVIIQVGSYKTRKKRVFKMAPLHHHFELLGYHESTIVSMYVLISVILSLIGLWGISKMII